VIALVVLDMFVEAEVQRGIGMDVVTMFQPARPPLNDERGASGGVCIRRVARRSSMRLAQPYHDEPGHRSISSAAAPAGTS